ncbi:vascular endothelial growth factor receptor 3-like [Frieseomelitta varia]|uniref:vascular endothelial growth factor receptor 3-like n=1 Tax=Frieseomelitta varia TaxID=561572 RepID=UPI001CB6B271|nr:vascular endothelial growth factor receptor 3-like [Frieseomelitta varia]
MLVRIQSLLIYVALVLSYLYNENYAKNTNEFVGAVRNLSVKFLQGWNYKEKHDAYKFLKLNISWLPPNSIKQPSSYSVIVTGTPIRGKNVAECPKGSFFSILKGNAKHNIVFPEYNDLFNIPDLYIQPNCSYKVQVFANPRSKYVLNAPEVVYTVPSNCVNANTTLPIPKVNTFQREDEIVVTWSPTFNTSNVQYYKISIGIPLFLSKNGLPVYNMTELALIPANKTIFSWDLKANNRHAKIKNGYKIVVNAVNHHGCTGSAEDIIIHSVSPTNRNIWLISIGISTSCVLFGIASFLLYRNYNFFIIRKSSKPGMHTISGYKCKLTRTILRAYNALYIKYESEEGYIVDTDNLKVPFKSVRLMRELGTGHFGKVYLGHLDDKDKTLVAVKMSQQTDISKDSETRQEFIKEIEIMRIAGNHPHLVSLVGYCVQPTEPTCIVLEYMQGGDLLTYLHDQRNQQFLYDSMYSTMQNKTNNYKSDQYTNIANNCREGIDVSKTLYATMCSVIWNKINSFKSRQYTNITSNYREAIDNKENWIGRIKGHQFLKFATEIAAGMEHLEAKRITHRDLAARNILLSANLTVKISDFGLSRNGIYIIKNAEEKTHHLPIRWMSPEALYKLAFSSKSDVWSFGVVLWEICTLGDFPYANVQDDRIFRHIVHENGRLEQPDNVPPSIYNLMQSCWVTECENRPNFTRLLSELRILTASSNNSFRTIPNPCYALAYPEKFT